MWVWIGVVPAHNGNGQLELATVSVVIKSAIWVLVPTVASTAQMPPQKWTEQQLILDDTKELKLVTHCARQQERHQCRIVDMISVDFIVNIIVGALTLGRHAAGNAPCYGLLCKIFNILLKVRKRNVNGRCSTLVLQYKIYCNSPARTVRPTIQRQ